MRSILFFGIYMERIDIGARTMNTWKVLAVFASAPDGRDYGLSERLISAKDLSIQTTACRSAALFPFAGCRRTAGCRNPKKGLDKIGFPV